MEAVNAQVRALTEELGILKSELVQVKSVHANLHQQAVEAGAHNSRMFTEQAGRIEAAAKKIDDITHGEIIFLPLFSSIIQIDVQLMLQIYIIETDCDFTS